MLAAPAPGWAGGTAAPYRHGTALADPLATGPAAVAPALSQPATECLTSLRRPASGSRCQCRGAGGSRAWWGSLAACPKLGMRPETRPWRTAAI